MTAYETFVEAMSEGGRALGLYLTWQRVLALVIAFFLSGAIQTLMSQGFVMKYFGPKAKKWLSYIIAATSGAILSVCSCSVLPMFASIRKRGAGIGPAVTFLFSGPAINILAITMTFDLGVDIGIARITSAIIISIIVGLLMFLIFNKTEEKDENQDMFQTEEEKPRAWWKTALFFLTMVAMMISGFKALPNIIATSSLFVFLVVQVIVFFKKDEIKEWFSSTWTLTKKIVPLFLVGVFIAGMITYLIPQNVVITLVGGNTVYGNLIASVFGAFMYFATLTEIPIVQSFLALGMGRGAAIALLLAGPSLSLPNMIVIGKVMGVKKTLTYVGLVILFATLFGLLCGAIFAAI